MKKYKVSFSVVSGEFNTRSFIFEVWAKTSQDVEAYVKKEYGSIAKVENMSIMETNDVMLG